MVKMATYNPYSWNTGPPHPPKQSHPYYGVPRRKSEGFSAIVKPPDNNHNGIQNFPVYHPTPIAGSTQRLPAPEAASAVTTRQPDAALDKTTAYGGSATSPEVVAVNHDKTMADQRQSASLQIMENMIRLLIPAVTAVATATMAEQHLQEERAGMNKDDNGKSLMPNRPRNARAESGSEETSDSSVPYSPEMPAYTPSSPSSSDSEEEGEEEETRPVADGSVDRKSDKRDVDDRVAAPVPRQSILTDAGRASFRPYSPGSPIHPSETYRPLSPKFMKSGQVDRGGGHSQDSVGVKRKGVPDAGEGGRTNKLRKRIPGVSGNGGQSSSPSQPPASSRSKASPIRFPTPPRWRLSSPPPRHLPSTPEPVPPASLQTHLTFQKIAVAPSDCPDQRGRQSPKPQPRAHPSISGARRLPESLQVRLTFEKQQSVDIRSEPSPAREVVWPNGGACSTSHPSPGRRSSSPMVSTTTSDSVSSPSRAGGSPSRFPLDYSFSSNYDAMPSYSYAPTRPTYGSSSDPGAYGLASESQPGHPFQRISYEPPQPPRRNVVVFDPPRGPPDGDYRIHHYVPSSFSVPYDLGPPQRHQLPYDDPPYGGRPLQQQQHLRVPYGAPPAEPNRPFGYSPAAYGGYSVEQLRRPLQMPPAEFHDVDYRLEDRRHY